MGVDASITMSPATTSETDTQMESATLNLPAVVSPAEAGGGSAATIGSTLRVKVIKHSQMAAFGAWCCESLKSEDGTILLNVEALMDEMVDEHGKPVEWNDDDRKRAFMTTLMHEFGHALEEAFGLEHDELIVEAESTNIYCALEKGCSKAKACPHASNQVNPKGISL